MLGVFGTIPKQATDDRLYLAQDQDATVSLAITSVRSSVLNWWKSIGSDKIQLRVGSISLE